MNRISPRHLLGVLTIGVLVMALALFTVATTLRQRSNPLTPAQVTGTDAPVGKRVVVAGVVASTTADRKVTLVPEGATRPTVQVVPAADAPPVTFGKGVSAAFTGLLAKPGVLEDARPVRTGPGPGR